jgi:GDP-D-mannose 3',5'-epimerase
MAPDGGEIEIWGDGAQTRTFLYIEEALDGIERLMASDFTGPVNIGSEEMVSLDGLAAAIIAIAGKRLSMRHVPGPTGVRGRTSDNTLVRQRLGWAPSLPLREGLEKTYAWIAGQVAAAKSAAV